MIYDGDNNWDFSSDRILKTNIENEIGILDRIMKLNVKNYHLNSSDKTRNKEIGFIAQDVEPLFPSLVTLMPHNKYGTVKGLGYTTFGVLAMGGIKELKTEKDAEITSLKAEISELKKQIEELKQIIQK